MRELQWFQYFQLVLLEIPNVRFGMAFANPVTDNGIYNYMIAHTLLAWRVSTNWRSVHA